jgi:DNA-binding NarL/FixJ family response regulator
MIRVLLVDDHPVVLEGLRAMLTQEPDIEVAGECASGQDAVRAAAELRPDVVLMDLRMPGMDGAEATARITAATNVTVLALTTFDTSRDILRAIDAGAAGYLLKDTPRRQLAEAVRSAARGETVLAPPVAAKLVTAARGPTGSALSRREIQVLECVARGLSNAETGQALFISEATVKTHLLRAFDKLGVSDRTAAVTTAIARGILPPPE